MTRLILHLNEGSDGILALRTARHLVDRPDKAVAIMQYGGETGPIVFARRNRSSITAYEQPIR